MVTHDYMFDFYELQGWSGYAGTHVPMSVPRLVLMKPGQIYSIFTEV